MPNRSFYHEILTEHNLHPMHKHPLPEANVVLDGVNPSCGDEITLQLRLEEGKILEGAFVGEGCAISQASVDIMLDQIIGQDIEFARRRLRLFLRMIQERPMRRRSRSWKKRVRCGIFPICRRE